MSEALEKFLLSVLGSALVGAIELVNGKSHDEAVAKTILDLETKRAKEKFPDLEVKP